MGFLPLVATMAFFVASHLAISRPAIREPLVARFGRNGYGALHGIFSLVTLAAVFWGFWQAPYIELWPPLAVFRAVPPVVMPLACILFVAGMTTRGAGLRGDRLPKGDKPAPGILSITRHPVPWAIVIWAGAHIVANGHVAGVIFFGTFLAFGALAPALVDRRRRRCGEESWKWFSAASRTMPFAAPGRIDWKGIGMTRVLAGFVLYIVILLLHGYVIGVEPIGF